MKAFEAWNIIIKKLNGKKDTFISKKRLGAVPMEFTATSDGVHLILLGRFQGGGAVYLRQLDFNEIYSQYFKPTFNSSGDAQMTIDCVCAVIERFCIKGDEKFNMY